MMREQDIDKIFKQKLSSMKVAPSPRVWKGIEARLGGASPARGVVFWLGWGAAAVVLLALGLLWLWPGKQDYDQRQLAGNRIPEVKQKVEQSAGAEHEKSLEKQQGIVESVKPSTGTGMSELRTTRNAPAREPQHRLDGAPAEQTATDTPPAVSKHPGKSPGMMKPSYLASRKAALIPRPGEPETGLVKEEHDTENTTSIGTLFAYMEQEKERKQKFRITMKVGGEYSPTYAYREVSGGNSMVRGSENSESGVMTGSGGLKVSIQMHPRWSVESGVRYAALGQEVTASVRGEQFYTSAGETSKVIPLQNIALQNSMGTIQTPEISMSPVLAPGYSPNGMKGDYVNIDAAVPGASQVDIEQLLGYVEVPFTLRYLLFERGLSLSLSGGISTNWLVDNSTYLYQPGRKNDLGATEGIADVSFSTHAGLALSLPVYGPFTLQVEPRVSYFLSDINPSFPSSFKPYSVGVFTGIFYSFGGR